MALSRAAEKRRGWRARKMTRHPPPSIQPFFLSLLSLLLPTFKLIEVDERAWSAQSCGTAVLDAAAETSQPLSGATSLQEKLNCLINIFFIGTGNHANDCDPPAGSSSCLRALLSLGSAGLWCRSMGGRGNCWWLQP